MTTLIIFILVLGLIVFVHEFGHFIFAKKAGVYVYQFSLGFGPKLFSFKRKNDETEYFIRWIPLGGYVALAGESLDEEDIEKVPEEKRLYNIKWHKRLLIMVAGVMNNFILAFVLLFIMGMFSGATFNTNELKNINKNYPLYHAGARDGDKIIKINDTKISDYDDIQTKIAIEGTKAKLNITIKTKDNKEKTLAVKSKYNKKSKKYEYGISTKSIKEKGIVSSLKYACYKFKAIYKQMFVVIKSLFTGKLGVGSLSGPVGIYKVVGVAQSSIMMLIYLTAYLSINVGFINLLPIPAFDGGHVLFLIIEKIKGSKVNPKVEETVTTIFFVLLMLLMLGITIKDIINF